jgi:hypothetical protein
VLFGAQAYFGRANVHVDGDTAAWTVSFLNLLETGAYTANPEHPHGSFARMPAYSFVIGAFYLASGRDLATAYRALAWSQILVDSACVYIFFRMGLTVFGALRPAIVLGALYASYPFVIVWTPVVYSEALAVNTMIASVYIFAHRRRPLHAAASGGLLGVGVLLRPQLLVMAPLMALSIAYRGNGRSGLRDAAAFVAGLALVYGPWPVRNYVQHGRLVLTQDISGFKNWAPDVLSFMQYIYSVKAEWEPQFTEIARNQVPRFPPEAYAVAGDGEKLERAVHLAQTCGSGFTRWKQSVRAPLSGPNCDDEIAQLFGELRKSQYRNNPVNAYLKVPFKNLRKAIFKQTLNDTGSTARRLASYFFSYRTVLVLIGLGAAITLLYRGTDATGVIWLSLTYALVWYVLLCAGTLPQLRNIEMRYLLPADILLLVPAAGALDYAIRTAATFLGMAPEPLEH